ncbi:MAG: hypothetical protein RLZZ09_1836 [Pseudomonadota bacterium]|jgi:hypothetical protein
MAAHLRICSGVGIPGRILNFALAGYSPKDKADSIRPVLDIYDYTMEMACKYQMEEI